MDSEDQLIETAVQQPASTLGEVVELLTTQVQSNRVAILQVTRAVKSLQEKVDGLQRKQAHD